MMKRILFFSLALVLGQAALASGDRMSRSEYIDKWKDEAVYQMVMHKIPASITLAQGILESGNGNSTLASKSNNHFGIKCHSTWEGEKTYHDDDKKGECFRVYPDAYESFDDHSDFLKKKRYESLFELKMTDYKGWAKGLKKCGYATDPSYAKRLIDIIESNNLEQFDKEGIAMIKKGKTPERGYSKPTEEELIAMADVDKKDKKRKARSKTSDDLPNVTVKLDRTIKLSNNNIKYILAKSGDSYESIAKELEVMPWQIRKYNDLEATHQFSDGELVYIQPKRGMAKEKFHVVQEGETIRDISQRYGIKIKKIYKKNRMEPGSAIQPGQKLALRTPGS